MLATTPPGRTAEEKELLQGMVQELRGLVAAANWNHLQPLAVSCRYVLAQLGNPVCLTLHLGQHFSCTRQRMETTLELDVQIQGTGRERWQSAAGTLLLHCNSAAQVAVALQAYEADASPMQEQLATHYFGTFYNA